MKVALDPAPDSETEAVSSTFGTPTIVTESAGFILFANVLADPVQVTTTHYDITTTPPGAAHPSGSAGRPRAS